MIHYRDRVTALAPPVHALVIVDIQTAFVTGDGAVPAAAPLLAHITDLLDRARRSGAFIVHLQNDGPAGADDEPGTAGWQLYLPVQHGPNEVVIRKTHDDGFAGTRLADLLEQQRVTALGICGVMSEMCVSATARTALALGLRVVMPHDAHATQDIPAAPWLGEIVPAAIAARAAEWALSNRVELVARAAEVSFGAATGVVGSPHNDRQK
jgi:nicotinamidase-related amidase